MKTILIVEESEVISSALSAALCSKYSVQVCTQGSAAQDSLEQLKPDVLLINLSLSRTDGFSVINRSAYKPPMIFAFTYFLADPVVEEAAALGVRHIFLLPCSIASVVRSIETALSAEKI